MYPKIQPSKKGLSESRKHALSLFFSLLFLGINIYMYILNVQKRYLYLIPISLMYDESGDKSL